MCRAQVTGHLAHMLKHYLHYALSALCLCAICKSTMQYNTLCTMHYVRHLAQMLEHCPAKYTGENTLCYRDGLLSKMTPASVLIYAKSTFDSWQCAMNFTILFLSVAIVTFGNLALCLLIIQSPFLLCCGWWS